MNAKGKASEEGEAAIFQEKGTGIRISPEGKRPERGNIAVLPAGTPVFLRLAEKVTSRRKPGDIVQMEVYPDVKVDDMVVIEKGARAWGTVDSGTRGPRRAGIGGDLEIEINGAYALTGDLVNLRASAAQHGADRGGMVEDPFSVIILLLTKGPHAKVQKGASLLAYVSSDTALDAALLRSTNAKLQAERSPRPGAKPVVHIYGKDYQGKPASPSIFLDDTLVARIGEDRFLTLEVPSGKHTFKSTRNQLELDLQEGQEVYLRLTTKGFWSKGFLELVSLEEGEVEMYPLAPVNPKHIQKQPGNESKATFVVR